MNFIDRSNAMIQIITRPNGMQFHIDPEHPTWRFLGPKPKSTSPPPLPPAAAAPTEIIEQASARTGEREGRR